MYLPGALQSRQLAGLLPPPTPATSPCSPLKHAYNSVLTDGESVLVGLSMYRTDRIYQEEVGKRGKR